MVGGHPYTRNILYIYLDLFGDRSCFVCFGWWSFVFGDFFGGRMEDAARSVTGVVQGIISWGNPPRNTVWEEA